MKLTLLFSVLALAGFTYAGPSEAAASAVRQAQQRRESANLAAIAGSEYGSEYKWAAVSNGKGGIALKPERNSDPISIALVKSPKGASCENGACCSAKK